MSLDAIYLFWEILIIENEPDLIFFFALAVIDFNKEKILNLD